MSLGSDLSLIVFELGQGQVCMTCAGYKESNLPITPINRPIYWYWRIIGLAYHNNSNIESVMEWPIYQLIGMCIKRAQITQ